MRTAGGRQSDPSRSKYRDPLHDRASLAFLAGITIANIEAPLSKQLPRTQLVRQLKNLAKITNGGWLLASTDSNQEEAENRAMYFENALLELNHLFRMAEELPFTGFDPYAFRYDPFWIPESSQLAHTALTTRDMSVTVRSPYWSGTIGIKAQTRFHLKNSFKYGDKFFTSCAESAGYTVVRRWEHSKPMRLYLLRVTPEARHQRSENISSFAPTQPCNVAA